MYARESRKKRDLNFDYQPLALPEKTLGSEAGDFFVSLD